MNVNIREYSFDMETHAGHRAALVALMQAEQWARLAMSRAIGDLYADKDERGRVTRLPGMPLYRFTLAAAVDMLPLLTDRCLFYEWEDASALEAGASDGDACYTQARSLIEAEILHRLLASGEPWSTDATLAAWLDLAASVWKHCPPETFALSMLWEHVFMGNLS